MSIIWQSRVNKVLFSLLCALTLFSCATVDTDEIDNLNNGKILKLGHAGLGFTSPINPFNPYPTNGITALKKALEYGADGVEVDLQMTKDSILVLYHDLKLEGSTNLEGCIQEKTWSEIEDAQYELGFFYDLFHSDKIVRLDSLLLRFQALDNFPYIHFDTRIYNMCAENTYSTRMAPVLIRLLSQYQIPINKVLIISSTLPFLKHLQSIDNPYKISYEETEDFDKGLNNVLELGITSITIKPKLLTKEKVAEAHKNYIEIVTFGAKSRSGNAQLIRLNPDAIQSNNVKVLIDLLEN